jgi:hypothetical protein
LAASWREIAPKGASDELSTIMIRNRGAKRFDGMSAWRLKTVSVPRELSNHARKRLTEGEARLVAFEDRSIK